MDELTKAIIAAAQELQDEYGWGMSDDGVAIVTANGTFVTTMLKHIAPLFGDGGRLARIEALKAELEQLEARR
jgi:hypothetical protein